MEDTCIDHKMLLKCPAEVRAIAPISARLSAETAAVRTKAVNMKSTAKRHSSQPSFKPRCRSKSVQKAVYPALTLKGPHKRIVNNPASERRRRGAKAEIAQRFTHRSTMRGDVFLSVLVHSCVFRSVKTILRNTSRANTRKFCAQHRELARGTLGDCRAQVSLRMCMKSCSTAPKC